MIKLLIKFVTLASFSMALGAASSVKPVLVAGGGAVQDTKDTSTSTNPPPARGTKATHAAKTKAKPSKQSAIDDPGFAQGYRAAYATIYERNDYAAAIAQLKALGHDDHPNVANLIGYSYRKLGDYKLSQVWYERALQA